MSTKWTRFIGFLRVPNIDISVACEENQPIKQELPEIVEVLKLWTYKVKVFRFLQIFLGIVATFFSLLTATLVGIANIDGIAKGTAFVAALAVALITAFDLSTKSNNIVRAWRKLYIAVIKFNKKISTKEDVIKAYEEAENIIGDVTYQGNSTQGT